LNWLLQAIAATGSHYYSKDAFDRERFDEVAGIADTMLADLGNVSLERIAGLIPQSGGGYATPSIDVRGAVLRDKTVLLVQEKTDGLWTLPGGFADVGSSAAENVMKEIREEASMDVRVTALYSVRHKAKHDYLPDVRDFYKFFFLCESTGGQEPSPGSETDGAAFFSLDEIPALSRGRTIERDILDAFAFRDIQARTVFD
jgi:ADP-ribose pyrophosphatase YjhB (NUDIX family)